MVKETTTEPDHRDQVEIKIPKPFKFVEEEIKMEGWQPEKITKAYERKMMKNLLSSDPVLQVLKPKLIDGIQGPVSISASASNMLKRIFIA